MTSRLKRARRKGYALPEALVATAIAAGVLTTTASAVGGAVRLDRASHISATHLAEAKTIAARLRAGQSDAQAIDGFSGWRIDREPFEEDAYRNRQAFFDMVTASHDDDHILAIEILAPHREAQQ